MKLPRYVIKLTGQSTATETLYTPKETPARPLYVRTETWHWQPDTRNHATRFRHSTASRFITRYLNLQRATIHEMP